MARGVGDQPTAQIPAETLGLDEKDPTYGAVRDISETEANRKLSMFHSDHKWDPNMSNDAFEVIDEVTGTRDVKAEAHLVGDMIENSPYPEVRAVVRNYDEELPVSTIRAWVIGLLLTTIASGLNSLFNLRLPLITITPYVVQLVAYPIGRGWHLVFPDREFKLLGLRFNLNPGPFNIKEHTIIVVMANAAFGGGTGYFTDTIVSLQKFYHFKSWGWGYNILFALSTQCLGFGIAGMFRRWLVEPAAMIWPAALVNTAFMYALHDHSPSDPSKTHGWSMSRYKWFLIMFTASFLWYWFPGVIFQGLSYFSFVTWIRPNNVIINQLFGVATGISLIPITFDWSQVTSALQSPLIAPWHAIGNTLIGVIFFFWIITCAVHYSGVWYGAYLPISDNNVWDNTQTVYNVSKVLTAEHVADPASYEAYSPLFLSTTFALAYGLSFASIAALISHTGLFHGREIWQRWKSSRGELDDIHMKMMRKYKLVPFWWYGIILVVMIAFSFAAIYGYPTHMAWYSLILAFAISFVWTIPIGMVQAFTNIQLGLNVFTEFIIGYLQPGKPVAMMMFKTYGYITMTQALYFTQDLKLGHYLKVPQRPMFFAQTIATIWSCLVQLAVMEWALGAIKNICTDEASGKFNCGAIKTFYNASVIWGVIGPKHIFSEGAVYVGLQYFWLAGFIFPFIIYGLARAFPRSNFRFLSAPVIFGSTGWIPPLTPLNYLTWCTVGWIFNKHIRNKYRGWWMRYNYITSAGLDVGLAISTIVIFFAITLPGKSFPSWWGNDYIYTTADQQGGQLNIQKVLQPGETFGPPAGSWKW